MVINWAAFAAIVSFASFVATLLIGAFVHGKLTQRVADHDHRILKLEDRADTVDDKLADHGNEITRIKVHLKLDK